MILKNRFQNHQIRSFFWSAFSRIWTEYGHFLRKPPPSVRIWENTDQKNLHIWTLFTKCEINVLYSLSMPLLKYLYKDQPISWNLLLVMAWNTFWAILLQFFARFMRTLFLCFFYVVHCLQKQLFVAVLRNRYL